MSDLTPELQQGYIVDSIEFRDRMVVVNFTDPDNLKGPIQDHISRVIMAGADEDVDGMVREIMDDVQELLNLAHIAKRNPPRSRPA